MAPGGSYPADRPGILAQLSGLDRQVADARSQRALSSREVASLQRELRSIRNREDAMEHDRMGNLSARNEAELQARIDRLNSRLRTDLRS